MALIKCENCGKSISDTTDNCIHCGQKINKEISHEKGSKEKKNNSSNIKPLIFNNILAVIIIILGIIVLNKGSDKTSLVPDSKLIGYPRYVGGDAYNYIMESSIKGGQISGIKSANATYISTYEAAGYIIIALGLFKIKITK